MPNYKRLPGHTIDSVSNNNQSSCKFTTLQHTLNSKSTKLDTIMEVACISWTPFGIPTAGCLANPALTRFIIPYLPANVHKCTAQQPPCLLRQPLSLLSNELIEHDLENVPRTWVARAQIDVPPRASWPTVRPPPFGSRPVYTSALALHGCLRSAVGKAPRSRSPLGVMHASFKFEGCWELLLARQSSKILLLVSQYVSLGLGWV